MTDSEYNLDPNCLSRCSTELFSETSWEQVDKQDTEVSPRPNLKIILSTEGKRPRAVAVCVWSSCVCTSCISLEMTAEDQLSWDQSVPYRWRAGSQTIWQPNVTAVRAGSGWPPGSITAGQYWGVIKLCKVPTEISCPYLCSLRLKIHCAWLRGKTGI